MSFMTARRQATHDFYGPVHKGIRLALCNLVVRLGAADPADPAAVSALLGDLRGQLAFCEQHLEHEDREVHTALEARAPGSAQRLEEAHAEHRASFDDLAVLIATVEAAADRTAALRRLYLGFSRFMAADFAHMAEEEQVILPVLQSLFTDEELIAMEDRIMASIPPEDMVACARIMLPAANPAERIALLDAVRASAPAEGFAAIVELAAKSTLTKAEWAAVARGLQLAA